MAWSRGFRVVVFLCGLGCAAGFAAGLASAQTRGSGYARLPKPPRPDPFEVMRVRGQFARKDVPAEPAKKKGEINCAVVKWDPNDSNPVLTLVCPPHQVFTPVRVYLRISWNKLEDIPKNLHRIVAAPHTPARLHPTSEGLRVRLRVSDKGDEAGKEEWIAFNSVLGFSLEGE